MWGGGKPGGISAGQNLTRTKYFRFKAPGARGIAYSEIPEKAKGCPGMAPQNQTQEVVA